MNIKEKKFTPEHLKDCQLIKKISNNDFDLSPINNICLIFQKLKELNNIEGDYVECGTYKGNTLIPSALFSLTTGNFKNKKLIGIDTFKGFPIKEHHNYDVPSHFQKLFSNNLITEDHYDKAKLRTDSFNNISHLENEYFLNVDEVFNNCSKFNNVSLIKGTFGEITPNFKNKISVLHLDGDLYESYLTCLNNLYDNVVERGTIIFDEYYSHKYPGARVAVDEFFENKTDEGYFEKYVTEEGHERWCFNKIKN